MLNAFFLILVLASACFAEGPRYRHKDPATNIEFQNVYKDIRSISVSTATTPSSEVTYSSMSVSYLGISSSPAIVNIASGTINELYSNTSIAASSMTLNNYFHYMGTTAVFGYGPVMGATATPVAGGGLGAQRWYWKVYPIGPYGQVGTPSGMTSATIIAGGANLSARISWTLTEGASYYAITRHASQQGPNGYSTSSVVSGGFGVFTDTGGALINGNPWSGQIGSTVAFFNGAIVVPASSGGLYFWSYFENKPQGYVQQTSANELVLYPGYGGTYPAIHMADQWERGMLVFQRGRPFVDPAVATETVKIVGFNGSTNYDDIWMVNKSSFVIVPSAADVSNNWYFNTTGLNSAPGRSVILLDSSASFAGSIKNVTAGQRSITFGTNVSSAVHVNPSGELQGYLGAQISTGGYADFANSTIFYATGSAINLKGAKTATPTGMVGEYLFSNRTTSIGLSGTNVWSNVTSTTVSAGVWEVSGSACANTNGATITYLSYAVSTGSGTTTTDHVAGANNLGMHAPSSGTPDTCVSIPSYRIVTTANTEIFMKVQAGYTVATPIVWGSIRAWRK